MALICLLCDTSHHPAEACDQIMAVWIAEKRRRAFAEIVATTIRPPPRRAMTPDEFDDETYRQEGFEYGQGGWR
jgi:hypothetical protein